MNDPDLDVFTNEYRFACAPPHHEHAATRIGRFSRWE